MNTNRYNVYRDPSSDDLYVATNGGYMLLDDFTGDGGVLYTAAGVRLVKCGSYTAAQLEEL